MKNISQALAFACSLFGFVFLAACGVADFGWWGLLLGIPGAYLGLVIGRLPRLIAPMITSRRERENASRPDRQSDPLAVFKNGCLGAFGFLVEMHGFSLLPDKQRNPFHVIFQRGPVTVGVEGWGWGSHATIYYLTRAGVQVPYQCVPPDWQPQRKRKKNRKGTPEPTQLEQIFEAAKIIAERDLDILRGDLSPVEAAAERLRPKL